MWMRTHSSSLYESFIVTKKEVLRLGYYSHKVIDIKMLYQYYVQQRNLDGHCNNRIVQVNNSSFLKDESYPFARPKNFIPWHCNAVQCIVGPGVDRFFLC